MNERLVGVISSLLVLVAVEAKSQTVEKVTFDKSDSTHGYYLAISPQSNQVKGTVVLLTSFFSPEALLTETKLHGVTYTNDILLVVLSMKQKLYADTFAIRRLNVVLNEVRAKFGADTSKFALAGYDEAGGIALRYTELTQQYPTQYPVQPKAVVGIDSPVDIFGMWRWSERQIKKNFWPGAVGDAKFYIETMTKENGALHGNEAKYTSLTPFDKDADGPGNEQYLKNVAVRLYYDADIEWHLQNRRNSLYDTKLPDASELISRLLLMGNDKASFIATKKQGVRNNGNRHPGTISIVEEVEFVQWIKRSLDIFDHNNWIAPYRLPVPAGWSTETFSLPPDFASALTFKGVEDIRFAPGWGDSLKADYWTYAYLWWLEGKPTVDAVSLQQNLQLYYDGLVTRNITARKIPEQKMIRTEVMVKNNKPAPGDLQTYNGSIRMLDYMTQKPIVLNTVIHVKTCSNKTGIFIKLSPKNSKHPVWTEMDKIYSGFSCEDSGGRR